MNASGDFIDLSDFTISSAVDEDISDTGSGDNILTPKQFVIKNDKTQDLQLLKLELSKKSLELDKFKKDFFLREEELQDRIDALLHQRDTIQYQLENEIRLHKEETSKRQEQIKHQLEQANKHQNYLENTNEKLIQSTLELKNILSENLRVDEYKYEDLKLKSEYELSIRELLQVKIFEIIQPLLKEIGNFKYQNSQLKIESNELQNEVDYTKSSLKEEQEAHLELRKEFNKNLIELSDVKDRVKIGDYKIENFDKIQRNSELLEQKHDSITLELNRLKVNFAAMENERDQLIKNQIDVNQSYRLLTLDKEYLTKQVNELMCRCNSAEDRLQVAWRQLEDSKTSREQLYDKYVVARDEFRAQYENKLKDELDSLRFKTEHEMEKIKINTKELYERENKSLADQKDIAVAERDIAIRNSKEVEDKLEKLKFEFSSYQVSAENKISEFLNEIKIKSFELERNNILYDESRNKLKMANLDCEKFQAKIDVLTKEYYEIECETSKRISELELKLEEANKKVISYEKLEQELDLAVMHAAEDDKGRPVLMWPHGYDSGNPIPTQAGRRMQHSIELARRILHLERMLKERNHQIETLNKQSENLQNDLNASEKILNEAKQPYGYLIDALKNRDSDITKLKLIQNDLINQLNKIRREKSKISEEKNRMASDLEQLLSQKDEFLKLKTIVQEIKNESQFKNQIVVNKNPKEDHLKTYQNPINLPKFAHQEYSVSRS